MAQRTRVLLLVPHLRGGGAGKVTALLARGLPAAGYEVHLGLVVRAATQPASALVTPRELPPAVTVHDLHVRRVRYAALKLLRLVWRVRPHVILSNTAHLNFLVLAMRGWFPRGTSVLARQNGMASAMASGDRRPWLARAKYRLLYPRADRVICQTQAMADELAAAGFERESIAVLPNPVEVEAVRQATPEPGLWTGPGPHLLAVGRLAPEKGFDLLIDAMARLRRDFPDAALTVLGEGDERAGLEKQAHMLGLDSAVRFAGQVDPPWPWFAGATLFVLSSRHEGMPNALLEAATAGLPIVATPALGGVADLLAPMHGAWTADSISAEALAEALRTALHALAPEERFHREKLAAQHEMGNAMGAYAALIDAACALRPL